MKINKVTITIENIDEENASVRLSTDPVPGENEELEDTPALALGSAVWDVVQDFLEDESNLGKAFKNMETGTLQ